MSGTTYETGAEGLTFGQLRARVGEEEEAAERERERCERAEREGDASGASAAAMREHKHRLKANVYWELSSRMAAETAAMESRARSRMIDRPRMPLRRMPVARSGRPLT